MSSTNPGQTPSERASGASPGTTEAANAARTTPDAATTSRTEPGRDARFAFGDNWQRFVRNHLDASARERARGSIQRLLRVEDLRGASVLDVGCGSGLFSLAAHELGAERLVSFDLDPVSVECCASLRTEAGGPPGWQILHGSILDPAFVERLGLFDVVYAWGVLHHTGRMWDALGCTARCVGPGGLLALAIYNRVDGRWRGSRFWEREKRLHARSSPPVKRLLEAGYAGYLVARAVMTFQHPLANFTTRGQRGMNWLVDVRDWVGGYPYEYASAGEIFEFCRRNLDLSLESLRTTNGYGNNEFVFRRSA